MESTMLEAAAILLELPDLIYKDLQRNKLQFLRWAVRKHRSCPPDDPPPVPKSSPAPPPPPVQEAKTKNGETTSSPNTPLDFNLSAGEEAEARRALPAPPPPPPTVAHRKPFKNGRRHKEWMKEERDKIAKISAENENLRLLTAEARSWFQQLKATNSWLQERKTKLASSSAQKLESMNVRRPVVPTVLQSPQLMAFMPPMLDLHHYQQQQQSRHGVHPPVPGMARMAQTRGIHGGRVHLLLDLDSSPEERKQPPAPQPQRDSVQLRAAAHARKRRIEIRREKNSWGSSSTSYLSYKVPRLTT